MLDLNPELKGGSVPWDGKEYLLKVPAPKRREALRLAQFCWKMAKLAALEKP